MENLIRNKIKENMKNKNKIATITYRSILDNAQKYAKNDGNRELNDDDIIKAIKNEIKQLEDLYQFVKNDSDKTVELIEKIDYCKEVLPKQASEEDILNYLKDNNIEKNIGICMKSLKEHFGSNMDGKMANGVVRNYIGG